MKAFDVAVITTLKMTKTELQLALAEAPNHFFNF